MILVFGKTGQVGTELEAFEEVKSLGRDQADLSNPQSCIDAIYLYNPRAVINAAGYTSVDRAEREFHLACLINGEAPGAMATACAKMNIPLLHISTDYVFDGTGVSSWQVSDPPNPKNAYGKSKLKGEVLIEASGCIYAILRTSWVVSSHGSNFVKKMLYLSETADSLNIVNDQVGGPTCARNIAHTSVSIINQLIKDPRKTGVYHYSGSPNVTWFQFANVIMEQAKRQIIVKPISSLEHPTLALRPSNSRLGCELTESVFGISRPYWADGLKNILEELENNHDKS